MLGFRGRERDGSETRRMSGIERSQFVADLDIAWRFGDNPRGDKETLSRAAQLPPSEAALELVACLNETDEVLDLKDRLGNLGVLTGKLSKSKAIPGGVIGIWRSDCPVILFTEEQPSGYDRAEETAKALSVLMYRYENQAAAKEITELMKPYLTEMTGQASVSELPRRRLGLTAFREH